MDDERGPLQLRRFTFDRTADVSGSSGTGAVVEGVEFSDGQVVIRWRTQPHSSIAIYKSMEAAIHIHGHDGSTTLRYLDGAELQAVYDLGDELDSNHTRWAVTQIAERFGVPVRVHNDFSEPPRNRNEEQKAELQAEIDRLSNPDALRDWLRHKVWCNAKTDDPPDTERCKCGLRAALKGTP